MGFLTKAFFLVCMAAILGGGSVEVQGTPTPTPVLKCNSCFYDDKGALKSSACAKTTCASDGDVHKSIEVFNKATGAHIQKADAAVAGSAAEPPQQDQSNGGGAGNGEVNEPQGEATPEPPAPEPEATGEASSEEPAAAEGGKVPGAAGLSEGDEEAETEAPAEEEATEAAAEEASERRRRGARVVRSPQQFMCVKMKGKFGIAGGKEIGGTYLGCADVSRAPQDGKYEIKATEEIGGVNFKGGELFVCDDSKGKNSCNPPAPVVKGGSAPTRGALTALFSSIVVLLLAQA